MGVRSAVYSIYERRLRAHLTGLPIPNHVAVMLDGNRRWARAAGFEDVTEGHLAGAAHITNLLDWCTEAKVDHVTLWLLSTDNLGRPAAELDPLLAIIAGVAEELAADAKPWRVNPVGALDLLPEKTASALKDAADRTADRKGLMVNVAVGYGGAARSPTRCGRCCKSTRRPVGRSRNLRRCSMSTTSPSTFTRRGSPIPTW